MWPERLAPSRAPCLLGGRIAAVSDPGPARWLRAGPSSSSSRLCAWPDSGRDGTSLEPRVQLQLPTQPRPACPAFAVAAQVTAVGGGLGAGAGACPCPVCNVPREGLAPSTTPAPHNGVRVWSGSQPGGRLPQTAPRSQPSAQPRHPWVPTQTQPLRTTMAWISMRGAHRRLGPWPSARGIGNTEESRALGAPHLLTFGDYLVAVFHQAQRPPGGKGPAHVRPLLLPPWSHWCENPSWAIPNRSPSFPVWVLWLSRSRPLSALPGSAGEEAGRPSRSLERDRARAGGAGAGDPPLGPRPPPLGGSSILMP